LTDPATAPPAPTEKAQFWTETIAAFTASGLSVRAFCASRDLREKQFYTWRRHLGLSPVAPPPAATDALARPLVADRVVSEAMDEVVLPGGLTFRVPVASKPAGVARLVAALRAATCRFSAPRGTRLVAALVRRRAAIGTGEGPGKFVHGWLDGRTRPKPPELKTPQAVPSLGR
jgi:hypothetical protein